MAILHRNPMPLSGALFITNPRKFVMRENRGTPPQKSLASFFRGADDLTAKGSKETPKSVKKSVTKVTIKELQKQAKELGLHSYSDRKKSSLQRMIKKAKADSNYKGPKQKKRKTSSWQSFQSSLSALGVPRQELKTVYGKKKSKKDLTQIKRAIQAEAKKLAKIGKRTYRKAYEKVKSEQPTLFTQNPRSYMKRKMRRLKKNPILSKALGVVGNVQSKVEQFPVVKNVAWAVTPIALGAGVYFVHKTVEPHVVGALAQVPVVGGAVSRFPYTATSLIAGLALIFASKKGYLDSSSAMKVAGAAATVGVALDLALKPSSSDLSGYGDGGQYMIGRDSTALGEMVHNDTFIHMGDVVPNHHHVDYGDASMADAQKCTCVMLPEEIAAAKAGKVAFFQKFGQSPINLKSSQSLYSRHAGRIGHRYGWLIKMIGFENFQKIASLPPQQRATVISQLQQQAIASIPQIIASQNAQNGQIESASIPVDGTLNGPQGFGSSSYGALMFAGSGY